MDCFKKEECRLCESKRLTPIVKLTPTPPGNHFFSESQMKEKQAAYPLELDFCEDCGHVQLAHVVNPKILYQKNYSYVSAISPVFVKHLKDYADYILERYPLNEDALVLDIGSNDGTAVSFFQEKGYRILGIDPAIEVVQDANERGIKTLCEFFNYDIAIKYRDEYGKAALINSHNACAHIDDLPGVIRGVKHWLAEDGIFVMEVGYLLDVYQNAWFDTIYHEHVDFHTVAPLVSFFLRFNLEMIRVERISPQGGSIRVIVQHRYGPHKPDDSIQELIDLERNIGLDKVATFQAFHDHILEIKNKLRTLLAEIKSQDKSIAGFGAPTKATTLLAHFELNKALDFLVDDNPLKQGLYSPGAHIPVYAAEAVYDRKPDYLLILAWNFAPSIMAKHEAFLEQGGKFILPMPEPMVLDKETYEKTYTCYSAAS